jgi:hypothetical protein
LKIHGILNGIVLSSKELYCGLFLEAKTLNLFTNDIFLKKKQNKYIEELFEKLY